MISGFYVAVAGLFLVYLSARVIRLRRTRKISVGAADDADMERAMRVQANFTEYAPIVLLLLIVAELNSLPALAVHGFGVALLAARFIHFLGFRSADAPGLLRVLGMVLTFTLIALLAITVTYQYVLGG